MLKMDPADEQWTRPQKTIKLKKTKSQQQSKPSQNLSEQLKHSNPLQSIKRHFPFSPSQQANALGDGGQACKKAKLCQSFSRVVPPHSEESCLESEQNETNSNLPVDWSLKSRARFLSPHQLGWSQSLSTVEEASGVTAGTRCLSLTTGSHCLDQSNNAQFHSACLYWQHPSLPGTTLFPRFTASSIQRQPATLTISPDMARALHSDWQSSLTSVYQLVKARQCPYFYVCAPSFTCLFRAAGIAGSQQICALLSPTTSGMRAALKREDIEFTLPLYKPKDSAETAVPEEDTTKDWLESLGVSSDSLPGLSKESKTKSASSFSPDNRPESMVYVEGVECQSMINYLLNAKLTSGTTQAQAGLPPTLLAPVAFHGATLRALKVKQCLVGGVGGVPKQHMVELSGPILPHTIHKLCQLASRHVPSFSCTLLPLEDTSCFSLFRLPRNAVALSVFANTNLRDCGLRGDILERFCSAASDNVDEGCVIRDVKMEKGGYIWNTESEINNV